MKMKYLLPILAVLNFIAMLVICIIYSGQIVPTHVNVKMVVDMVGSISC